MTDPIQVPLLFTPSEIITLLGVVRSEVFEGDDLPQSLYDELACIENKLRNAMDMLLIVPMGENHG